MFSFKSKRFVATLLAIVFAVMAIIAICVTYKSKNVNEEVPTKPDYFNFETTNAADYEYMVSTYKNDSVRYFESQGRLAQPLDSSDGKVVMVKNVFAVNDTVFIFTHDTAYVDVKIEKIKSYWLEDQVTTPFCKVNLTQAIDSINKTNIIRPKSKVFVLRKPLYPPFPDHNYYIFGDFGHSPFIQVDSNTGEVKACEF